MPTLADLQGLIDRWLEKQNCWPLRWQDESLDDLFRYWDLVALDTVFEPRTGNECYLLGIYHVINGNEQADKCLMQGADLDHPPCIYQLMITNQDNSNYELAIKYGQRSIELGYMECLINVGFHYQYYLIDYQKMKEYYRLAMTKKMFHGFRNMGIYYRDIKSNSRKHVHYFQLAYEHGDTDPVVLTGILDYYRERLLSFTPDQLTDGFIFLFKHTQVEKVRTSQLLLMYQKQATVDRSVLHYLLRVENEQLISSYRLLKSLYLETLELTFYLQPTYFRILPRDVFTHLLLPYLDQ